MEKFIDLFKKPTVRRFLILAVIALLLYFMRSMINLFLLTFIFIYLVNAIQKFISSRVSKFIHIKRVIIIVGIYVILVSFLVLFLWHYIPKIAMQTVDAVKLISGSINDLLAGKSTGNALFDGIIEKLRNVDLQSYYTKASNYLVSFFGNVSTLTIDFALSIILSMFFLLQKGRCGKFISKFKDSKVSWLYDEIKFFGVKFSNTFGKVLETQILISFINCLLSIAFLAILGFPSVLGLGVMIFFLGLIPVAGVVISLFPLCIVAYTVGGFQYILYVLIIIAILHAMECYILNPKLMSSKTNIPVFFTFLIITVSGHFFGAWGMLVGLPVFVFVLDILGVDTSDHKKLPSAKELTNKIKHDVEQTKSEVAVKKEKNNAC